MEKYQIIRSNRKTVSMELTKDGELLIRAPFLMSESSIEQFIAKHERWIAIHRKRQQERKEKHPEPSPEQMKQLLEKAKNYLPQRIEFYSKKMDLYPTSIKVTHARTRFGSCSGKNAICFSVYLMQYPDEAIDYVIVHELAHIKYKNHGQAFYALIEKYLPDYKARIALLKK